MDAKDLETAKAEREKAVVDLAAEKAKREASDKKAAELEARLAKLEGEKRSARFAEEAKCLGLPTEMAAVLDKVEAAVGSEDYGKVATAFKAKVAQVTAGETFKEKGTTAAALPSGGTAMARVAVLAAEKMKEAGAGKLELRDAQSQVFAEHPELYEQYVAEARVRV